MSITSRNHLSDSLLSILDYYEPSGIEFFAPKEIVDDAIKCFQDQFTDAWYSEFPEAAERFGYEWSQETQEYMKEENPVPLEISHTDYGFYAKIGNLTIKSDFEAGYTGEISVSSALKKIEEDFPDISFRGYIGWLWHDKITCEPCQWECQKGNTGNSLVYESVKQALKKAVLDGDFWDQVIDGLISEPEENFVDILKLYSEWFDLGYLECLQNKGKEDPDREAVANSILASLKNPHNITK